LDPNFALAWAFLALSYADSGQTGPAGEAARRAYELRNRASDREQFFIAVTYERIVTGNLERARQTCMSWAQTYPRDPDAHGLASGMILQGLGDFDISIEEAKKALALDPDHSPSYTNLAYTYFLEGRMNDALDVRQQASARGFNPPEMLVLRYAIAFATEDTEGMKRAASAAAGKPWAEDWMTQTEALAAADRGQIRLARQHSRKAMEQAIRVGQPDRAAGYESRSPWMKLSLDFQGKLFEPRLKPCKCRTAAMLSTLPRLPSAWREMSSKPMFSGRICMTGFRTTQP
jgi:tetratricopeptide (TPR) repeat protein